VAPPPSAVDRFLISRRRESAVGFAFPIPAIPRDVGDHGDSLKPRGANRGPRQARCWLGGVEIRRASSCHRERAAQPGVERSKSAKPTSQPSA